MNKRLLFAALLLISIPAFAQHKVRFIVQEATAQKHDSIYITGSFSNWSPNNSNYLLKPLDATNKTITLNVAAGTYEFNFLKGDWSKMEKNRACAPVHRIFYINADTTINVLIKNWSDDCSVNLFSGDQWYLLRTDSVSALAELVLSLVILIYLLRIKNKSKDGWLITRYMIIMTTFYLADFLRNINETPWRMDIVQDFTNGWLVIYHVWFSYNYRKRFFRKEMIAVLVLLTILIHAALLIEIAIPRLWLVLIFIFTFAYLWSIAVLLRKAGAGSSATGIKKIELTSRDNKAFRSFAWWSSLFVLLGLNYIIVFAGNKVLYNPFLIFHTISLISLPWFAINYVNYAEEYTTFQVKLVGVMLCVTLLLLGLLGFMILPAGYIPQTEEGRPVQDAINILAVLVPVMTLIIVLLFNVFVKKNLLRPLKDVLDGVQRVNAGDLKVEVPVEVKDELGFLSHNFNQMTHSLRQYSENMESLVGQRTTELEHKSTQLEKQKAALQTTLEDLKATQAQLIQSEKMASLGELTAGIAHEIQNPLNFVNNFSELNKELLEDLKAERLKPKSETDDHLQNELINNVLNNSAKINQHGKRADAIVKGMLQHSRSSSGVRQPTDLNALCDEYLRLAYHGSRAKDQSFNATTKTEFDKSIGKINVMPQEIARVILNLINNAIYAVNEKAKHASTSSPKGSGQAAGQHYEPTVTVSTSKQNARPDGQAVGRGKVEIKVKDNGNGIPESIKEKIFQPFFTTKPTGQGTGLGLSLAYDIVRAHGGEIKVETRQGEGTTFIIHLPIQDA